MIVNSHPYNPSQQTQQQRCIGLNQLTSQESPIEETTTTNNQTASNMFGQQNSLYGSNTLGQQQQSHMLDLANLQQSVFDSNFDIQQQVNNHNSTKPRHQRQPQANKQRPLVDQQQQQQQQQHNDMSLYSPSSSTSLLYHIYDQINLPNEQQQYNQQATSQVGIKKNNTTTILNPANLFSNGQQQPPPLPLQMQFHQHQLSNSGLGDFGKAANQNYQQQCYTTPQSQYTHLQQQQQQPFSTLHHHNSQYQQQQMALADVLRQQHHTMSRRPLSSSGTSSGTTMSTTTAANNQLTYGRQPRTLQSNKGANNLASVLASSNALNHLGIIGAGLGTNSNSSTIAGKQNGALNTGGAPYCCLFNSRLKRFNQRLRNVFYEYRTIVKCSVLLILLALSLMTIIKFTLFSASSSPTPNPIYNQPEILHLPSNRSPFYQPAYLEKQPHVVPMQGPGASINNNQPLATAPDFGEVEPSKQDALMSKLVIGEFVILSQNYSHSEAQRSLLAERIIKLMDQVFLATDVRVVSRMEVTRIKPNKPMGISVECNIVLTESITHAAQLIGMALYSSLSKSDDRLANQANYIIDRNSIRFNTVPDKDLKSGIVPANLIPPSIARELQTESESPAPPTGPTTPHEEYPKQQQQSAHLDQFDLMNAVVWSAWSPWSSCYNKEGLCDSARLHSRLRTCVSQHTGEKASVSQCNAKFGSQDRELEVEDCQKVCQQATSSGLMSSPREEINDEPMGPQTAPSVLSNPGEILPSVVPPLMWGPMISSQKDPARSVVGYAGNKASSDVGLYTPSSVASSSTPSSTTTVNTIEPATTERTATDASTLTVSMPILQGQQMSCSNCTSDEICLLLVSSKVPFCAKMKDRSDDSGCGGWCKAPGQVCQPVGQNAFKCTLDSECLDSEWRCHDSGCIPLSKRCDGHSNCFDNSDERDCPIMS